MKARQLLAAVCAVGLLAAFAAADEKKTDNAKLLVGKWEVTKADADTVGVGTVVEFSKDGKMKVTGQDMTIEGTYKVNGDSFSISFKMGDNEKSHDLNIKKLDEKSLTVTDKDGKTVELMRKK
jgi:uncharacterized protein (TIGR03066 family)